LSGKKFDNFQHLKEIVIVVVISEFLEHHSKAKRTRTLAYSQALKERVAANEDKCTSKLSNVSMLSRHDLVHLQIIHIMLLFLQTPSTFQNKNQILRR